MSTIIYNAASEHTELSLLSNGGETEAERADEVYPTEELAFGTDIGAYIVESRLGSGGCGVVYLGRHKETSRQVAIKILHGHLTLAPKVVTRFLREIEMIELLHHPHIVAIEGTGALADGRPYYAMEYLGPMTLASICREQGTLSVADCLQILSPVCSALAAAHDAGIVHRDIKASNISVRPEGDRYVVKLLDFGVAKLGRHDADGTGFTTRGRVVGTLHVMAPEQLRGSEVDARADIYALGALLYRMLTGKVLFYSTIAMDVVFRHLQEPAPRPSLVSNVPPSIDAIVLRCLEKDPARRFQSVSSFIEAFRLAAEDYAEESETPRGEPVNAIGVYVELRPLKHEDTFDEALEDDTQQALDLAEQALSRAGFSMALATGNALLGVLELSVEDTAKALEERRAKAIASSLRRELAATTAKKGRIEVFVSLRVDRVLIERGDETRFLGGPLLHTEDWSTSADTRIIEGPFDFDRDHDAA